MSFDARLLVVALAAFAAASLAGSALVPFLARRAGRIGAVQETGAGARASTLVRIRLLPVALGSLAAALASGAYLGFEHRGAEPTGIVLQGLALVAAVFVTGGLVSGIRMTAHTTRVVREWTRTVEPLTLAGVSAPVLVVSSAFPVVAVVGVLRPRLVVARSVLDACSPDELRAVLAHEQHHLDRRDNLRHAMLAAAPDVLAWLPVSKRIAADWRHASEDAADDAVDRLGQSGRTLLAQALVRVARLAPPDVLSVPLPASTLLSDGGLERRVLRLLGPSARSGTGPSPMALPAFAVAAAIGVAGLGAVHRIIEAAVTHLP